MRTYHGVLIIFCISCFLQTKIGFAKPEPLAALFQASKASQSRTKKKSPPAVPEEYQVYSKAKSLLDQKSELSSIESTQRKILLHRMSSQSKSLERELEDIFYALEIKRGVKLSQKKAWAKSNDSFVRGLNGLGPFKWIYFWDESSSRALERVCLRQKKKKDEGCLAIAKRVVDAFPKSAVETKMLRELPFGDMPANSEGNGERLSQTYSEKVEKDEQAFQDVLENYLSGKDMDLLKSGKDFIEEFPRSVLRFRGTFLMAEVQFKRGDKKEAQLKYQTIIDQIPLSFYALIAAERLGISLRDQVKKAPIMVDQGLMNLNFFEKQSLERAKSLLASQLFDEVGIELDSLSRTRAYHSDLILYLMKLATEANQNLSAFRLANELIQRKYDGLLNREFLGLIFPERYTQEIEAQAKINNLDPILIQSLMKQESGFKSPILSSSGALGLMQVMPFTAVDTKKDVVLAKMKDPVMNISVGTKYLQSLYLQYEGNIPYTLAAYNAGPNRVAKWRKEAKPDYGMIQWIESIPYKETREYVMAILRNRYWYQYRKGLNNESLFSVWKNQ
jgi:soluble lytic murein transglycosylase-like protein